MAVEGALQNHEAERTLLGAIIVDNEALPKVAGLLSPKHFGLESHRILYEAMLALFERSDPIDLVTLKNELGTDLERAGGPAFIAMLIDGVPRITNPEHWARVVLEKARRRAAVVLAQRLLDDARSDEVETDTLLDQHQAALARLQEVSGASVQSLAQLLPESLRELETALNAPQGITGVPTGIAELDKLTAGLRRGSLFVLAARPARGKSSLCTQIAMHAASTGKRVLTFSMEMPPVEVAGRMLLQDAGLDRWGLRNDRSGDGWEKVARAVSRLGALPIRFDRRESPTLGQIRASCRQEQAAGGLDLVVVDYLQRCTVNAKLEQWLAVGEIAKGLKSLARALNVPVLAACQLSAEAEEKRPTLAHLAQSRQIIGAEADLIAFLHPEQPENWNVEDCPRVSLIVGKHRHGATGSIPLWFQKKSTRFISALSSTVAA
jgi:replicative DNA helicase